jgi:hypothetical protein
MHDASKHAWQAGSIVNTSVGWPQRKFLLDMGEIYCLLAHDMQLNISFSASVKVTQAG